jgi:hypothetical protein
MSDDVMGYLPNLCSISPGTLNGVFDNTATLGLHVIASSPASRIVTIPIGIQAAPLEGDPCFNGQFIQTGYHGEIAGPSVYAQVPFGEWDVANEIAYDQPWGVMLTPKATKTAVNSGDGVDDGYGGASSAGGYMVYHVFDGGNTNATIKIQDETTIDGAFGDLSGATSGEIDCSTEQKGIVELAVGATVKQYLRWQLVLDGGSGTVVFALAFIRGR